MPTPTVPSDATLARTTSFDAVVEAYVGAERYQEAAKLLADRYQRRRDRRDAEQLSAVLALCGDYQRAAGILFTLLDYEPTNADLHERLAEVYVGWGRVEEAAAARRAALVFSRAKQVIAEARQPNGWAGRR